MRLHILSLFLFSTLATASQQKSLLFLAQLQNTDTVLTFDSPERDGNDQSLGSENGYYFLRPDTVVQQQVETYLSQADGEFLIYPIDISAQATLIDVDE